MIISLGADSSDAFNQEKVKYHNHSDPTKAENYVIASIYLLISLVTIVLYIPCLFVISNHRVLKKHSCFRVWEKIQKDYLQLMFHMGLADLVNVIVQAIYASLTLFQRIETLDK